MALDKPLTDILRDSYYEHWVSGYAKDIKRIKQAFIDDGWVKDPKVTYMGAEFYFDQDGNPEPIRITANGSTFMTGQEWYDRFEKEVDEMNMQPPIIDGAYLDAARKASGIE